MNKIDNTSIREKSTITSTPEEKENNSNHVVSYEYIWATLINLFQRDTDQYIKYSRTLIYSMNYEINRLRENNNMNKRPKKIDKKLRI